MDINIKPIKDMWSVKVTIKKSGKSYAYNTLLYCEPTEIQVKMLWQTERKHFCRCS